MTLSFYFRETNRLYYENNNRKGWVDMDEMKLKLSTKFMRGIVSKLIARSIYKKYGYRVNVQLNDLDINIIDGEITINANVEAKINSDEFRKMMTKLVI